jgi:endonuclease III
MGDKTHGGGAFPLYCEERTSEGRDRANRPGEIIESGGDLIMATSKKSKVEKVMKEYGRTFCDELRIPIERNAPSPLFRCLVFALLSSTRIGHQAALEAARALSRKGWRTPRKMADATWRQRTDVLNRSGYARYDESTSRMLGDTSGILLERYKGDLRELRAEAEQDPVRERKLLKGLKGIGDVGVDIFFREAQAAWDELLPFADKRVLKASKKLGLGEDLSELSSLVKEDDFPRFAAGLVRIELENGYRSFD